MTNEQGFSGRWGLIITSLGMAIGAGNLWRFPRLAGQYGGSFILLWFLFLFVWSIPILLAEFAIGKRIRKNVVASFSNAAGWKFSWMGIFIFCCTLGITFYYSVVVSWGLHFLFWAFDFAFSSWTSDVPVTYDQVYFDNLWNTVSSNHWPTMLMHGGVIIVAVLVLVRGVQHGLEYASKILIPSLFVLLLVLAASTLSQEGGREGLAYMFNIRPELFSDPVVWVEALSQSAWSTGAGWGLIMTLGSYSKRDDDVTFNVVMSGLGNNVASMVCAVAIIPAVFLLAPSAQEAVSLLQTGNQALTFTVIPNLFEQLPAGEFVAILFFLAFSLAAFSSLLTMLEMFLRFVSDLGIPRGRALFIIAILCFVFGAPSAWSLDFFTNQDWVWGVGLILSGMFVTFAVLKIGIGNFKREWIDMPGNLKFPDLLFKIFMLSIIPLGLGLVYWWLSRGYSDYPWFDELGNWNFMDVYSNATVITQWALVLGAGALFSVFLRRKFEH